jgi:hypothetical protein
MEVVGTGSLVDGSEQRGFHCPECDPAIVTKLVRAMIRRQSVREDFPRLPSYCLFTLLDVDQPAASGLWTIRISRLRKWRKR